MTANQTPDPTVLDRPDVLIVLFHPRPEPPAAYGGPAQDLMIPVAADVAVGARFHFQGQDSPNLLFFHGNGEIVADYDELGPVYNAQGINLLAVDYRGYGRSSGQPSVAALLADSHAILTFTRQWLASFEEFPPRGGTTLGIDGVIRQLGGWLSVVAGAALALVALGDHLVLLAENNRGYHNLMWLVSEAYLSGSGRFSNSAFALIAADEQRHAEMLADIAEHYSFEENREASVCYLVLLEVDVPEGWGGAEAPEAADEAAARLKQKELRGLVKTLESVI